jgi:hypothetical protein
MLVHGVQHLRSAAACQCHGYELAVIGMETVEVGVIGEFGKTAIGRRDSHTLTILRHLQPVP